MRLITKLLLSFFPILLSAQNGTMGKLISYQEARSDFKLLTQSLEEVHPSLHRYQSEEKYQQNKEAILASLKDSISELELHKLVRQFIRPIGCGHTTAQPSIDWYQEQKEDSRIIPFTVFLIEGRIYIRQAFDQDSLLKPGSEILAINDRPSSQIIQDMFAIQEVDGRSDAFAHNRVQRLFGTYHLFLYGRHDTYDIDYLDSSQREKSVTLKGGLYGRSPDLRRVKKKALISGENTNLYILPSHNEASYALLDLDGFSNRGYKKFYRKVFKEIQEQKVEHLIIDLRANGGGYFPNGNRLLQYLLREDFAFHFSRPRQEVQKSDYLKMPFFSRLTRFSFNLMPDTDAADPHRNFRIKYRVKNKKAFRGKISVLIDGGTFSLGSYVASQLKHHLNCEVIGGETGGGESGSNAVLMYRLELAHSKIRVRIPYYHLDHKLPLARKDGGLIPDHRTSYNLEDRLRQKDLELEYLKLPDLN